MRTDHLYLQQTDGTVKTTVPGEKGRFMNWSRDNKYMYTSNKPSTFFDLIKWMLLRGHPQFTVQKRQRALMCQRYQMTNVTWHLYSQYHFFLNIFLW